MVRATPWARRRGPDHLGLKNSPSLTAWLALAALAVVVAIPALSGPRSDPSAAADASSPDATTFASRVEQAIAVAANAGLAAPAAVLLLGGPWQALLWWFILPTLAIAVTVPVFGMVVAFVAYRSGLRADAGPTDRRRINIASAMVVASALVIPAGLVALRSIGAELTTATACSLLVGFLSWQTTRRWFQRAERL